MRPIASDPRKTRTRIVYVGLVLGLLAGVTLLRDSLAELSFDRPRNEGTFEAGMWLTLGAATVLGFALLRALLSIARPWVWRSRRQAGTAMIELLLVIVPMYLMFAIIAQVAMLGYASLVVRHAAFTAARSAVVSQNDKIVAKQAAWFVLATVSDRGSGQSQAGQRAQDITQSQRSYWRDPQFAGKLSFAQIAGNVNFGSSGEVSATITFQYRLGVPGGHLIFPNHWRIIDGVSGYYTELHGSCSLSKQDEGILSNIVNELLPY